MLALNVRGGDNSQQIQKNKHHWVRLKDGFRRRFTTFDDVITTFDPTLF